MTPELVDAWRMSNEVNLFLLTKLPAAWLKDAYGSRTRDVGAQFAHMHAVRQRWLKHAAPALAEGLVTLPKSPPPTKTVLKRALKQSEQAIARFLEDSEAGGKVKGWKGPPASFLAYLVAHEAHHRGLAMVALRRAGRKVPDEVVYGQWDWGKQRSLRG